MSDPRILQFHIRKGTATNFQIQFSQDQENWTALVIASVTDLPVSDLDASDIYVLDGVNAIPDDANNNAVAASTPPNWYRTRTKTSGKWSQWGDPFLFPSQEDFIAGMKTQLKDPSLEGGPALLNDTDYRQKIANAVEAFERQHPLLVRSVSVVVTDILEYPLPDDWEPQFSAVQQIEYPVGISPRKFVPPDYAVPDEQLGTWRLLNWWPGPGESIALYYTARHARSGATIPFSFFNSVLMWATGDAAQQVRAHKNQFGNLSIGTEYVQIDPRIKQWAVIAETWKLQAEKIWGQGDTGFRTHLQGYDYHGRIPLNIFSAVR